MPDPIHLALIDDDEAVLDALRQYFARHNIETSCFKEWLTEQVRGAACL